MNDPEPPPSPARTRRSVNRRQALTGLGAVALSGMSAAAYAVGVEPRSLGVTRYALSSTRWRGGPPLRIAALADLHACDPWMNVERIASIVERTNGLQPDLIVLLGDYVRAMKLTTGVVAPGDWAAALSALDAPLGVHAILGNHDWWDDSTAQEELGGSPVARLALERVGIPVYENNAIRLDKDGRSFWLAGLGDQIAFMEAIRAGRTAPAAGIDNLPATLAPIPAGAPTILRAHEPDIFPQVPDTVALTLCGHTHGGQIRVLGYSPVVPSRFRNRYAYGHIREHTDLIVSGGLGCSRFPIRLGVPPEIVLVELSAA